MAEEKAVDDFSRKTRSKKSIPYEAVNIDPTLQLRLMIRF